VRSRQRQRDIRDIRSRRGANPRLPFKRRQKKPRIRLGLVLGALSVLLLAAAGGAYLLVYHQGDIADRNAQNLLNEYEKAAAQSPSAPPAPPSALPSATDAAEGETSLPGDGYVQPEAPDVDPRDALVSVPGYDVIGKLRIGKIGVELPVISAVSEEALKVSVCWYYGALPGEPGNMVITGHNYRNGAHFGNLHTLAAGDEVVFDAPGGKVYRYEIYETQVVRPDDVKALDAYEGEYGLTLVTCAYSGNRRLIVRCRLAGG
jgi:LPXTG-site transpeptidase (sortase) family protein